MRAFTTTEILPLLDELGTDSDAAREKLIEHTCDRLRDLARRMLSRYPRLQRWEDTDDVLQNALIRLHRSLRDVHPTSARQYIGLAATQLRRELLDLSRSHFGPHGQGKRHHSDDALALDQADGCEPVTLEQWTAFHAAVEELSPSEREVFELRWYKGLKPTEIAELLQLSLRTVNRRWTSAKVALYEALGQRPE